MKYVAVHALTIGSPALTDKNTGEEKRASTLQTLAAGDPVPDIDEAERDRLIELGAIVEQDKAAAAGASESAGKPANEPAPAGKPANEPAPEDDAKHPKRKGF